MAKFTSALNILGTDLHVTLCFCEVEKAGKFRTEQGRGSGRVVRVEYWEKPDITVAIISSDFVMERHLYYKKLGYTYDLEFIPHATLGKGDITKTAELSVGNLVHFHDEYARTFN